MRKKKNSYKVEAGYAMRGWESACLKVAQKN